MVDKIRFYILAPPYRHNSMGVKVLHKLCDMINRSGEELGCCATTASKQRRDDFFYNDKEVLEEPQSDIILIAPDIDSTKFIKYRWRKVIKYALNYPFFYAIGDRKYDHDDMILVYDDKFMEGMFDDLKNKSKCVPFWINSIDVDKNIFVEDLSITKDCDCFWVGKGHRDCHVEGIEINHNYPCQQKDLVTLLQKCRNFYSFDTNTSLTQEAFRCGANVFMRYSGNWIAFNEFSPSFMGFDLISKPSTDISILIESTRRICK